MLNTKKTIVEKIFSLKSGTDASAGMTVICEVDKMMTNDASGPLTMEIMHNYGYSKVADPQKVAVFMDHYTPCPNDKVAKLQQSIVDFVDNNPGITLTKTGCGICHHLMVEYGFVQPGKLIIGGDSHSTTYGFLDAVGIGVGSTDMAVAMITGKLWFRVPETIFVRFTGRPQKYISGKDIALVLVNKIGPNGANYKAIEFGGEGLANLSIDDRKTICNLMAECGAKCAIMPIDEVAALYIKNSGLDDSQAVGPDNGCHYVKEVNVDLSEITYTVALPHNVHTTEKADALKNVKIDMALLGTCTGGKITDFREAANVLKNIDGKFKSEVLVVPASQVILLAMISEGIAQLLIEKGAMILPAGCGPCCGSSPGVPRDGFNVISTANRNFIGRMGNTKASIYLASPSVVATSAMLGRIATPSEVLK